MKSTDSFLTSEIEELSLRMPRPVAIYLCESEATEKGFPSVRQQQQHTTE
jgi:hypothetical protein